MPSSLPGETGQHHAAACCAQQSGRPKPFWRLFVPAPKGVGQCRRRARLLLCPSRFSPCWLPLGVKAPIAAWWCGHLDDANEHGNMVSGGSPVCTDSQGWLLVWRSVLQHVYRVSSQWVMRLANRLSRFKYSSGREYSPHGITQRLSVWRGISMRW